MKRIVLLASLGLFGCDDGDAGPQGSTSSTSGSAGSTGGMSTGEVDASAGSTGSPGTTDAGTTGAATSSTGSGESSTGAGEGSTGADESSTGAEGVVGFAEIQLDLENMGGAQGQYPSCIEGVPCHNNPARNVVLVADPTPEELMQNYQNILDAPGVPWVTPMDDTAQMLNEVPIPDDVRARWLAWIEAGAPFE